ncbi:MAG: hypothetical protein HZB16_03295 [Armatimonadetes bacterium]|nr:hypothetical protein [Armatimonadota bacterium]
MNSGTYVALGACLLGWASLGVYASMLISRARQLPSPEEHAPDDAPTVTVRDA